MSLFTAGLRPACSRMLLRSGKHAFSTSSSQVARPAFARSTFGRSWRTAGLQAMAASTLVYCLWQTRSDLFPSLPVAHAEEAATYIDPTTKTPFSSTFTTPSGKQLKLLGTGVRVVSFLGIRVYAAGIYASPEVVSDVKKGKVEGFKDFSPTKLLPPPAAKSGETPVLAGELLVQKLVEAKYDFAVVIIPLRNTSLPHLRDGFARALVARLKLPQVASAISPEETEAAATALNDLKSFFPARSLLKSHPLNVYLSGVSQSLLFTLPDSENPSKSVVLGTLDNAVLAKQLILSYFSDSAVISEELRDSVAKGLAGEPR